jgi:hypothetical protein
MMEGQCEGRHALISFIARNLLARMPIPPLSHAGARKGGASCCKICVLRKMGLRLLKYRSTRGKTRIIAQDDIHIDTSLQSVYMRGGTLAHAGKLYRFDDLIVLWIWSSTTFE